MTVKKEKKITERQLLTIEHLKMVGIIEVADIVAFCKDKLTKARRKTGGTPNQRKPKSQTRVHSKKYYQGLIDYLTPPQVKE